jgi:hypothetical protein
MDYLVRRDFVRVAGQRNRCLVRGRELLAEWAAGYAARLRRKCLLGRFSPRDPQAWRTLPVAPGHACLGGELAAERLTAGVLRASSVVVHVYGSPTQVMAHLGLRRDPRGPVSLMTAFWPAADEPSPGTAPALVVYAELLASPSSRDWEAAAELYRHHLRAGLEHD